MNMPSDKTVLHTPVDMTRTMPPEIPGLNSRIRGALAHVSELNDLDLIVQRHRFFGTSGEKEVAANWLERRLQLNLDREQLYITGGTQACLAVLLPFLIGRGGCIATETMSYAGTTQVARLFGIPVVGVEIDEQGVLPDAFERVCKRDRPKVLYCNPTIHNPTTSILPMERRLAIAEVARKYSVAIIEDDVHAKLVPDAPPPIAAVAPDITWYLMSVSKCIGMGLRLAFLVAPSPAALAHVRAWVPSVSSWFVGGIASALVTQLIRTGAADEIAGEVRSEVEERQSVAQEALKGLSFQSKKNSLHLWLTLPEHWTVAGLVHAVEPKNVVIRPSDLFNAGGITMPNKLRLSLVSPKTRHDLRYAMSTIVDTLQSEPADDHRLR
ncbi:PLP-dependent aminotransferase family protein [Sinorhizobium medicae]|nr:PLP-dependent aminotransferase family protein [Sinorhizobium medicae]